MSQGQSSSKLPKKYQGNFIWSYGEVDPSTVATLGAKNQFYVNLTDGTLYQKNDDGVTTNWSVCAFSSSGPSQITVNSQNGVEELDFQGEIQVVVSGNTATLTLPKRVGTVGGFTDTDTLVIGSGLNATQSNPNEVTLTATPSGIDVDTNSGVTKIVSGSNLSSIISGPNEVTLNVTIPTPTITVGAFSGISTISAGTGISITNPISGTAQISSNMTITGDPEAISYFTNAGALTTLPDFRFVTLTSTMSIAQIKPINSNSSKATIILGTDLTNPFQSNISTGCFIASGEGDNRTSSCSWSFISLTNNSNLIGGAINSSLVIGNNLDANGANGGSTNYSAIIANNTNIGYGSLNGSLIIGQNHALQGVNGNPTDINYNIISGYNHIISAGATLNRSILIGYGHQVSGTRLYVNLFGYGHLPNQDYVSAFGRYSDLTDANLLFALGYGADAGHRANVFDVGQDGLIREYGAKRVKVSAQSGATYTLNARTDYAIEFTNGGAITITLSSGVDGQKYEIKLTNGTNATINAATGETINGLSSYLLGINLCCSLLFRNGNWLVCADDNEVIDYDNLSKYMSDKDTGVFKTIEWKTSSGVLRKKSVLSGGTAPQFTTRTVTFYDQTGVLISSKTLTYTLSYDIDGDVTSEVL